MANPPGLLAFVQKLEKANELKRISVPVSPKLEITEITDRITKAGGPALLFENTGTAFPLLINAYGSERRMALALGVDSIDAVSQRILTLFRQLTEPKASLWEKLSLLPKLGEVASYLPRRWRGRKAPCQEVVYLGKEARLSMLPILTCWPQDGGPFITLPIVHTYHPATRNRNVGMYRVQVFDDYTTAIHWQLHKVSRRHYEAWKAKGEKMPVAIALGGDPVYAYAATAPLPENIDEYILAGFLRKRAVELVPCITQPIEVPADADIVIEGYVDPSEPLVLEGPFGDHTGYYSLPDYYPAFHVTAITHRKDAIYPATIVGIPPQEDAWIGKATERIFLAPLRLAFLPELVDIELPVEGVFHNLAIASIRKEYPGQGMKAIHTLWGAGQLMLTKIALIVDEDVPLRDYWAVARAVVENTDLRTDLVFSQGPIDVLDHSCSQTGFGGKLGIDGTRKMPEERGLPPITYPTPAIDKLTVEALQQEHPELEGVNLRLIEAGIPIWIGRFRKTQKRHGIRLGEALARHPAFAGIKVILVIDGEMPIDDLRDVFWRFANNTDMRRDAKVVEDPEGRPHLVLDASTKTAELDDFTRAWPNVIVMSDEIIARVDKRWAEYGLGDFLPSPSLKYKPLLHGEGAVAYVPQQPFTS
ncbi:MAG: menaquinone biosynthesis decarboxylase [Bacteroidia bacterium]|nr:menaquinone biosynthesis decarboxylase [Bacteroidia bacterium]MCX7763906.1 menaquinone biosynthesis decarboxylase [Bacteroidia bacterium]MDW8058269.1 menaquinone biosynthesis decarboxylase [Bacteroidia bacterium]